MCDWDEIWSESFCEGGQMDRPWIIVSVKTLSNESHREQLESLITLAESRVFT